jgi:hypothetical protein
MLRHHLFAGCVLLVSTISVSAQTFDIKISYYDTYDNAIQRKAAIEDSLGHFAEGVYEVTNGAHKIGRVTIYTDGAFKDNTDIVWVQSCWPNAHTNGRGFAGSRIEHCDDFDGTDMLAGPRYGGYTIVHEWGHFTYAMFDEYSNSDQACGGDIGSPCADDVAVQNSIMNNQDKAIGEGDVLGDLAWLNFSTGLNNAADTNAHYRSYQASAWEVLIRPVSQDPVSLDGNRVFYQDLVSVAPAANAAPSFEINTPEGQQAARSDLVIEWKRGSDADGTRRKLRDSTFIGVVRMLVIDNSRLISAEQLEDVKTSVQQTIYDAEFGDVIGIQTFCDNEIAPLTLIDGEETQTQLADAVQNIQSCEQLPYLSQALDNARIALVNADTDPTFVSQIYLFAHGFNAEPGLVAQAALEQAGIPVYSFQLGPTWSDGTRLRHLSVETEGAYYETSDSQELTNMLNEAAMDSSPVVDIEVTSNYKTIEGQLNVPFYLDETLGDVEITVGYFGDDFSMSTTDPAGTTTEVAVDSICDIDTGENGDEEPILFCVLESADTIGEWQLNLTGNGEVFYSVNALPKTNNDAIFANIVQRGQKEWVDFGQPIILDARVGSNMPLTQLEVTGEVVTPDDIYDVTFKDDGVAPDRLAQDGIYSVSVDAPSIGEYEVTVWFDNREATAQYSNYSVNYAPNKAGQTPPATLTPMTQKFMRSSYAEIFVDDASEEYDRVMDWMETVIPQILTTWDMDELGDIDVYQGVRYYNTTGYAVGYYQDQLHLYHANMGLIPLGSIANYLPFAEAAGF